MLVGLFFLVRLALAGVTVNGCHDGESWCRFFLFLGEIDFQQHVAAPCLSLGAYPKTPNRRCSFRLSLAHLQGANSRCSLLGA